jgi:hypothetical protein
VLVLGLCGLGMWRLYGGGGAAFLSRSRGEPGGGAAGVVVLAGLVGGEDALVADGEQARGPEGERGQAG